MPFDQELPLCCPTAQPLLPPCLPASLPLSLLPSLHSLLHSLSVLGSLSGFRTPWRAPPDRSLPPWGLQFAGVFLLGASPCCCCLPVSPTGIPWVCGYGGHMWSAYHVPSALGICVDAFTESPQWLPMCRWTGDETRPREGDLVTLLPIASEGQYLSNSRVQPSLG